MINVRGGETHLLPRGLGEGEEEGQTWAHRDIWGGGVVDRRGSQIERKDKILPLSVRDAPVYLVSVRPAFDSGVGVRL